MHERFATKSYERAAFTNFGRHEKEDTKRCRREVWVVEKIEDVHDVELILLDVKRLIYSFIVFHLSLIVNQSPTNNNWGEREIHK